MKQESPQKLQGAWENFIIAFACSLKLDKFCLWLSKKLENKTIRLVVYGAIILMCLFILVIQTLAH